MAACTRNVLLGISSKFRRFSTSAVRIVSAVAIPDTESLYPPIKPRYPPGQYGSLSEASAWRIDAWRDELLTIPRVKERLERIAGSENRFMWTVEALDRRPRNIEFRQRLLKTHVVKDLPAEVYTIDDSVSAVYEQLRPLLIDHVQLQWQHHHGTVLQKAASGSASGIFVLYIKPISVDVSTRSRPRLCVSAALMYYRSLPFVISGST